MMVSTFDVPDVNSFRVEHEESHIILSGSESKLFYGTAHVRKRAIVSRPPLPNGYISFRIAQCHELVLPCHGNDPVQKTLQ